MARAAVWRKLAVNEVEEHIPHMGASREKAEFEAELNTLNPGDQIHGGRGPLRQVFGDRPAGTSLRER